jgi:hypothetical protein
MWLIVRETTSFPILFFSSMIRKTLTLSTHSFIWPHTIHVVDWESWYATIVIIYLRLLKYIRQETHFFGKLRKINNIFKQLVVKSIYHIHILLFI